MSETTAGERVRLNSREGVRRGPPVGRHLAAIGMILALGFIFWQLHGGEMYIEGGWNLVQADVSVVLLCLILMLGPAARLLPRVRPLVPWARELGIAMFVTAGLHLLILLDGRIPGTDEDAHTASARSIPESLIKSINPRFSPSQWE